MLCHTSHCTGECGSVIRIMLALAESVELLSTFLAEYSISTSLLALLVDIS